MNPRSQRAGPKMNLLALGRLRPVIAWNGINAVRFRPSAPIASPISRMRLRVARSSRSKRSSGNSGCRAICSSNLSSSSRQEPGLGARPIHDAVSRQPLFEPGKAKMPVVIDVEDHIDLGDEISFQRLPVLDHTAVKLDVDRDSRSLHAGDRGAVTAAEQCERQFDGERR